MSFGGSTGRVYACVRCGAVRCRVTVHVDSAGERVRARCSATGRKGQVGVERGSGRKPERRPERKQEDFSPRASARARPLAPRRRVCCGVTSRRRGFHGSIGRSNFRNRIRAAPRVRLPYVYGRACVRRNCCTEEEEESSSTSGQAGRRSIESPRRAGGSTAARRGKT